MKNKLFIILLLSTLLTCTKDKKQNSEVEVFIQQVSENMYFADTLPEFSPDAIPMLLENANNFYEISKFPANPIISQGPLKVTVCSVLLWTVEHIRLDYGDYSDKKYPSLMPELMIMGQEIKALDNEQMQEVYNLYYNWWYQGKVKDFKIIRQTNPLNKSPYSWK
ncbi:MAG: DUF4943 family protein [Bacteroidales bacterium]